MTRARARVLFRIGAVLLVAASVTACLPRYSGRDFKVLFDNYEPPPNTRMITSPPAITGNAAADARIRSIAVRRGYRLRSLHVGPRVTVAGVPLDPAAAGPLNGLIADARRAGHTLTASYGFRSVELQRTLFVRRISGYSAASIAAGRADGAINAALMWVAIPGYSKHHTGYTVDLRAAGGASFGGSAVGRWIARDNYAAAKARGFIPSYPSGAGLQGPEPEPWEFVYVGTKVIECGHDLVRGDRQAFTDCLRPLSPIGRVYRDMGGPSGVLGIPVQGEHGLPDQRGRRARYANGNIYWTAATGAHEVHGSIFREYGRQGGYGSPLGYPTADTRTDARNRTRYVNFERGRIYSFRADASTITVAHPFFSKHESVGGVHGVLAYPVHAPRRTTDGRAIYQGFENGRIYVMGARILQIHGSVYRLHESQGGVAGPYGHPETELIATGDGRGRTMRFERGLLWHTTATGAHALRGETLAAYLAGGRERGPLGYPTGSTAEVGDGVGTFATFERGRIYATPELGGHRLSGAVLTTYLAAGGPSGELGYPIGGLGPADPAGISHQPFQNGRIAYDTVTGTATVEALVPG